MREAKKTPTAEGKAPSHPAASGRITLDQALAVIGEHASTEERAARIFDELLHVLVVPFHRSMFWGDRLLTLDKAAAFRDDPAFKKAMKQVNSLTGATQYNDVDKISWRIATLVWAARKALRIPGDFVECGVFQGDMSWAVTEVVDLSFSGKDFYLYDTFAEADQQHSSSKDVSRASQIDDEHRTPFLFEAVRSRFAAKPYVRVVRGAIPDILLEVGPRAIAYLHIDLSRAETDALEVLFSRLSPGAVVVLDDYGWELHSAQRRAVDDFVTSKGYEVLELATGQGLVVTSFPPGMRVWQGHSHLTRDARFSRPTTSIGVSSNRDNGVSFNRLMSQRSNSTIIHVGFAFSGTTSLQENLFRNRPDLFYAGIPYEELGEIFSSVKYQEPEQYDHTIIARLCEEHIFSRMMPSQRIALSDETFVEQPANYFTPALMPVGTIARRLKLLFGRSMILFTIRSQYNSVISNYLTLKVNAASEGREIESFDAWILGNQTQVRNLYMRNLDMSHAIKIYQTVFGQDAVRVLPLELLTKRGKGAYLRRLAAITGLEFSQAEIDGYVRRHPSPPNDIALSSEQREFIRRRSARGNAFIAERFDLPLREFGYPWPS